MKRRMLKWLLRGSLAMSLGTALASGAAYAAAYRASSPKASELGVATVAVGVAIAALRLHLRRGGGVAYARRLGWAIAGTMIGGCWASVTLHEVPLAVSMVAAAASAVYVVLMAPNAAWDALDPPAKVGLRRWLGAVAIVAAATGLIGFGPVGDASQAGPRRCSGDLTPMVSVLARTARGELRGTVEVSFEGSEYACVWVTTQTGREDVALFVRGPGSPIGDAYRDEPAQAGPLQASTPRGCVVFAVSIDAPYSGGLGAHVPDVSLGRSYMWVASDSRTGEVNRPDRCPLD